MGAGEGLLGGVIGRVGVADEVAQEAPHRQDMSLEEGLEGRVLAPLRPTHQRVLGGLGGDGRWGSEQSKHDV
jgi:hypothetical protein